MTYASRLLTRDRDPTCTAAGLTEPGFVAKIAPRLQVWYPGPSAYRSARDLCIVSTGPCAYSSDTWRRLLGFVKKATCVLLLKINVLHRRLVLSLQVAIEGNVLINRKGFALRVARD